MSWMKLFAGGRFSLYENEENFGKLKTDFIFDIKDIAHSLSMQCRYGGHCRRFFSISEHSILMSHLCQNYPLEALMHDAIEAYIGDIPRPIKGSMFIEYYDEEMDSLDFIRISDYEDILLEKLSKQFGLIYPLPKEVKEWDSKICLIEGSVLFDDISDWVNYDKVPEREWQIGDSINFYSPEEAEKIFLERFDQLKNRFDDR